MKRLLIGAVLALACPAAAMAEDPGASPIGRGFLNSTVAPATPSFEFSADRDSSKVSLSLGNSRSWFGAERGGAMTLNFEEFSAVVTAPLTSSGDVTELATLDRLASDTTLSLSFRRGWAGGFQFPAAGKPSVDSNAPTWFIGATGKVGYHSFDVLDPATLQTNGVGRGSVSGKAFIGVLPGNSPLLILLGGEYQHAYKASDPVNLCGPPDAHGQQACHTGDTVGPVHDNGASVFVEMRAQWGDKFPVAIQPKLTRDFEAKAYSVEVPLYLMQNKDGGLTGGVRFNWRSDTKASSFGVFVGAPFSLF